MDSNSRLLGIIAQDDDDDVVVVVVVEDGVVVASDMESENCDDQGVCGDDGK